MAHRIIVVAIAVVMASSAKAQDAPPQLKGPAPQLQIARAIAMDGKVIVQFYDTHMVTKNVQVKRDGKDVTETVGVKVASLREIPVDGKNIRLLTPDGKAIDPKELPKRLTKPTLIAVFGFNPNDNPTPDPTYLRVLRDDVIVVAATYDKLVPPAK